MSKIQNYILFQQDKVKGWLFWQLEMQAWFLLVDSWYLARVQHCVWSKWLKCTWAVKIIPSFYNYKVLLYKN